MINLSLIDLQNYEQFEVKYPGSIQPHGMLLVIDLATLNIIQVSSNTRSFLGIKPKTLLGKSIRYLLSSDKIKDLLDFFNENDHEFVEIIKLKKSKIISKFQAVAHKIQDSIILELEPFLIEDNNPSIKLYNLLKNAITNIGLTNYLDETLQTIAKEIRKITQFDRVLVYRFDFDSSGVVLAEDKREDLDSYLGLHYPAYDIPTQARQFYSSNWLRIIPNVFEEAVPIIPRKHPVKNEELDLTRAVLRSVFPCHIQYLKNMGVSASMSISLMNEKSLWGLIACHHYSTRYINYETRKVCEFVGQFLSIELLYKQEQEFRNYRTQIKGIQTRIREGLIDHTQSIDNVIVKNQSSLLNLTRSQGVSICLDKQITLIGKTPNQKQVQDLINHFLDPRKTEIFYTDSLEKDYPKAEEFKETACGMLAISIFLSNSTYHIIWFRPEQCQEIQWAGNPSDVTIITDDQEIPQLCPRHSFALWKEVVNGKSLAWESLEIEAAQELKNTLLLAALEFSKQSQVILEEKTRQANAANLAKSQFLAKMSHELRTPLNAILGFTQMMNRDSSLSSQQQEYLGIINRSGEHLLSLINDVLEMSRIEAGQLTLNQTCFNLHELIKSVKELLTLKALSKGLELTVHQDEELPKYIEGDESKLRQIIVNLVGNAIKFTHVGHIDLYLSVLSHQPYTKEMMLQLEVKDTGIGINQDELETIFEAFKQTENNFQSKEGTGLGLSISRQFARLMGGDITVQSQLGQGSTFTCTIKMIMPTKIEGVLKKQSKRVIELASSQPEYRILVVEDVRDNQLLMVKMLESVGFQVRSANNGQEALEIWQTWQPQLIWMDMRMPVMDGYEASRQIRHQETTTPNLSTPVTIIALTATAFDEERKAILAVGCNDFVSKPFQEEVIFEMMQKYLGVRYIYEDSTPTLAFHSTLTHLDSQQLKADMTKMSKTWVNELYQAALSAREKRVKALIQQIPLEQSSLAKFLNQLLNNLAFEQIINLTEGIADEST